MSFLNPRSGMIFKMTKEEEEEVKIQSSEGQFRDADFAFGCFFLAFRTCDDVPVERRNGDSLAGDA